MRTSLTATLLLAVLSALYMTSLYGYLLFHSLAEVFSVVIACGIFMVVWNARRLLQNHYLLFIGIAYLYVGGIDFLHLLAYNGMGVFQGYGANLPTQLWIAGRYLEALSLLCATIFLHRKLAPRFTLVAYGLLTGLLLASIFYWKVFPDCFREDIGLTPFKIHSEYVICLILVAAIGLLIRNSKDLDRHVLILLIASIATAIAQELAFTTYLSVYGPANMIGHFLKIVSFYLLYKAIIQTSLVSPWNVLFRNLKQSEAKYRNLFENMTEEVHFWQIVRDEAGRIQTWRLVDANPPALKTWDRPSLGEIKGKTMDEILGPGAGDHYRPVVQKIMSEGVPYSFEDYFPNLDKYFRFTSIPLGDYFITTGADVTSIKKAELALRQSRDTLQAVLDGAPAGVVVADATGCMLLANAAAQSMFGSPVTGNAHGLRGGYRVSMLDGTPIPADELPLSLALAGQIVTDEEILVTRADGTQAIILANATPLRSGDGQPWGAVTVFQDITERKGMEAELQRLSQQRQLALDAARMGWWHYDPITRLASWDDRYRELFGVTGHQRPNDEILARLHPEDLPGVWAKVEAALDPANPQPYSAEYRINLPDGLMRWIEAHGIASFEGVGESRRATSFVGTVADITERKQAEQALREREERIRASLDEKEVLLKEIHHRVKNNMQVISSLMALQADNLRDPAMRSVLLDVTHRVRSMAMVHEKLYQSSDLARIELAEYVRSLLNYLWRAHATAASGIRLTLDLEPMSLPVNTAVPCGLILNELVGNALKHAFRGRAGGEVTVSLRSGAPGRVRLCVRDNGSGLPAGLEWRQGRSLGLRLVQMLAGQLHAAVEVSNGGGTEFTIMFEGLQI